MKSTTKVEDRILSIAAFGCYALAMTACGVATYTLVALSRTMYGDLGRGLYLTASQF